MTTVSQLRTWCTDHGYQAIHPVTKITPNGTFHMDFMTQVKIALVLTAVASAYYIGKEGIPDTWNGIKNVYSWIRNIFSGTKITTPTVTITSTPPVA